MRQLTTFLFLLSLSAQAAPDFTVADTLFRNRHEPEKAKQALELYRSFWETDMSNNAASWRFAMAAQFVGFRLTTDPEEKKTLFREGRDAALAAAKRDPKCVECQFWAGIQSALYGESVGVMKMLVNVKTIREHLKRAAALDPSYAHGGPYRILGLIEQKLPGVLGGDNERAREYFQKAIAADPKSPLNYLFLAKFLNDTMKDKAGALKAQKDGLALPIPPVDDVESHEAWNELKALFPGQTVSATGKP